MKPKSLESFRRSPGAALPFARKLLAWMSFGMATTCEMVYSQTTNTFTPNFATTTTGSSTSGNANITVTGTYSLGQEIRFTGTTAATNPFGTTATTYYVVGVGTGTIQVSATPGGAALNATNTITSAVTANQYADWQTATNWSTASVANSNSTLANFGNTPAGSFFGVAVSGTNTIYGLTYTGAGNNDLNIDGGADATSAGTLNFATHDATVPVITVNSSGTSRLLNLGGTKTLNISGNQGLAFRSSIGAVTGSGISATATQVTKQTRLTSVSWTGFSGGIGIERGEVQIQNNDQLATSQDLAVGNAYSNTNSTIAVLSMNGKNQTIGNLNGNSWGRIRGNGTGTLTIGSGNATGGDFGGIIGQGMDGTLGSVNISKTGSGIQTISGLIKSTGTITINGAGGTLVISGTNTSSGATKITAGTLRANDATGLSTTSALSLDGGVLESIGVATFTRSLGTAANTVQWSANGGGFSANGGKMTVNIGNAGAELVYGATVGTNLIGTLKFGSATASAETELLNGIDLAGTTRTVDVTAGAGGDSATLSGNIRSTSGANVGLTKTGTGILLLKGSNTYDGTTTVSGGTLEVSGGAAIPNSGAVSLANTAGVTLKLGANETIGSLAGGGTTGGTVNLQANTLTTGAANTDTTFSGIVSGTGGSIVKTGTGTFTLGNTANSFTGGITISNGSLAAAGSGGNSAVGAANAIQLGDASNNNVTLQLNNWNNLVAANTINVVGSGTHTIVGTHNNTGQVHIAGGAITLNSNDLTIRNTNLAGWRINGGTTGSGNITFENNNSGGTGNDISIRSALNNTGSITNAGTGNYNLAVSGTNGGSIGANVTNIIQNSATSNFDLNAAIHSGTAASVEVRAGSMLLNNASSLRVANTVAVGLGATLDVRQSNTIAGLNNISGVGGTITNNSAADTVLTVGAASGAYTFAGSLSDGSTNKLGLTKSGGSTQTLSGTNTYTGATVVSGGTLALGATGSIDNTSGVSLGTSGTLDVSAKSGGYSVGNLSGSGDVIGTLTVTSNLAIGNSPGTVNFSSDLTLGSSSTYAYELIGGTTGLNSADLADVAGNLTIDSGAILDLVQLGSYTANDKFTLFAYSGSLTGTFSGLSEGTEFTDAGGIWKISYSDVSPGTNGGSGVSYVTITAIPEPAAALLGGIGVFFLLRRRRC